MYYTKYRPQTFAQITRPNEVADALMNQLKSSKTVHAYLFTGPRGVGKTTMARLLAKGLNCANLTKDGDVCGKCEFCLGVQNGSLMDLVEIDAASNRGIDDIRELREKVKLMPAQAKKKVYIIDEVHMLTNEAFNALLKTLEEPPKHAVFILCTTEIHKVPETIKSRCQVFKFRRPKQNQIVEKLKFIAQSEKVIEKIAEDQFERMAMFAGGAFRDAETMLQQFIEGGHGSFGGDLVGNYSEFLLGLKETTPKKSLEIISTVFDEGVDLAVWTDGLLRYLRDCLYLNMGFLDDYFALSSEQLEERKRVARAFSKSWLVQAIEVFNQAQNDLKSYSLLQLALEVAVAKLFLGDKSREGLGETPVLPKKPEFNQSDKEKRALSDQAPKDEHETNPPLEEVKGIGFKKAGDMAGAKATIIALESVESRWKEVVAQVTKLNNSVGALVKSGKPVQIEGEVVVLEVAYKFHKERLESSANKKLVEKVLEEVFGDKLVLKCIVCQRVELKKDGETGDLTDLNIRIPQDMVITGSTAVTDVFDGGLSI